MKEFAIYLDRLAALVEQSSDRRRLLCPSDISPALNGEPSDTLRRLVSLEDRRRDGVYFTGSALGEQVASSLAGQLSSASVVTDPACGGGDLLLAIAKHLPKNLSLQDTLALWGSMLQGTDIHPEFVSSTKLRLVLQAVALGTVRSRVHREQVADLFPRIRVADGLADFEQLKSSTHIVTNPPFSMVPTPPGCNWTSGSVNSAAVFLDVITQTIEPGTRVLTILPDVLRSGSRYSEWRDLVSSRLCGVRVKFFGQFSPHADVDVFLLEGKRRLRKSSPKTPALFSGARDARGLPTIGDRFSIHVGPVVPHRHKKQGTEYPFLTCNNCPRWGTVERIKARRRFTGRVFRPPFVVIRRTSRSNDRHRAVGTVVLGDELLAVENHLLLAIPVSGSVQDCHDLLRLLKAPSTSTWLNHRVCCRHLTVSSVALIPWESETV